MTTSAQVRAWAGAELADCHVLAVLELLEDTHTTLADWRLHVASYSRWAGAKKRTEQERQAVWIGEQYRHHQRRRVLFLIPQ